jgi:hypothetical protein
LPLRGLARLEHLPEARRFGEIVHVDDQTRSIRAIKLVAWGAILIDFVYLIERHSRWLRFSRDLIQLLYQV